tara:strand:+ start:4125 stop:4706 length:582 start_codon:yes stop_codon:yes gene_type:complete
MKPYLKWTAISVGSIVAIAHIGVLGHLVRREPDRVQVPTINIPRGTPYSSYKIEAGKDGYTIEYKANDPAILESQRSLDLDKQSSGFFGGNKSEVRSEYRQDQYTMEGTRNMGGGEIGEVGKIGGVSAECLVADAGARSQGAMAGTSVAAGVLVPAVSSIPYVGWLASGWALLLGQNIGSAAGSTVNSMISDC